MLDTVKLKMMLFDTLFLLFSWVTACCIDDLCN
jgi:hypothetical protein